MSSDRKPVIKSADMPDDMQQDAVELAAVVESLVPLKPVNYELCSNQAKLLSLDISNKMKACCHRHRRNLFWRKTLQSMSRKNLMRSILPHGTVWSAKALVCPKS